jgi:hypothetical protein
MNPEAFTIDDDVQQIFGNFIEWVSNYNDYISSEWEDKHINNLSTDDAALVDEFITINPAAED